MFFIEKDSIKNKSYQFKPLEDNWFLDSDYKEKALITGSQLVN